MIKYYSLPASTTLNNMNKLILAIVVESDPKASFKNSNFTEV